MSEDAGLKQIDAELAGILNNFQLSVSRLKGKAADTDRIKRCEELMKRYQLATENYQVDLGAVTNPAVRSQWSEKLDKHMDNFSNLKFKYQEKKVEYEKQTFLQTKKDITQKAKGLTGEEDVTTLDRQQAIAVGDVIVGKATASVERSKQMALESEQLGNQTLQKMQEQQEKMEAIYESFEEIEGNVARSRKLLGKIAQGAANDRMIQCLCIFIVIAIVVAVTLNQTTVDTPAPSNGVTGTR